MLSDFRPGNVCGCRLARREVRKTPVPLSLTQNPCRRRRGTDMPPGIGPDFDVEVGFKRTQADVGNERLVQLEDPGAPGRDNAK